MKHNIFSMMRTLWIPGLLALSATNASAQITLAADDASNTEYDDGFQFGDGLSGTGFSNAGLGGVATTALFVGDSTSNGTDDNFDNDINTPPGRALGLRVPAGSDARYSISFNGPTAPGDIFTMEYDTPSTATADLCLVGLSAPGSNFSGFGYSQTSLSYIVEDTSNGLRSTSAPVSDEGVRLTWHMLTDFGYRLTYEVLDGSFTDTIEGNFGASYPSSTFIQLNNFPSATQEEVFFNSMSLTDQPPQILRSLASGAAQTNANSIDFDVSFTEPVLSLTTSDFQSSLGTISNVNVTSGQLTPPITLNNSLELDGTNYALATPASSLLPSASDYTLEAWINIDQFPSSNQTIVATDLVSIVLTPEGEIIPRVDGQVDRDLNFSLSRGVFNQWTHIAVAYEGPDFLESRVLYVNGEFATAGFAAGTNPTRTSMTSSEIAIGARPDGTEPFEGYIDEVRVWNTQRDETQIGDNWDQTLTGTETGLIAYYQFESYENLGVNSDGADDIRDLTANGLHADGDTTLLPLLDFDADIANTATVTVDVTSVEGIVELGLSPTATTEDVVGQTPIAFTPFLESQTVTVDHIAPVSSVTGPGGAVTSPNPVINVTYTAVDATTSVAGVELFYQRDGGGFIQYPGGPYTSSPIAFDTSTTGDSGIYEFYTIGTDAVGNTESAPSSSDVTFTFNNNSSVDQWMILDD